MKYYASGQPTRVYHHTAPVNSLYAINEALRLVLDETLQARWDRHREAANHLYMRLEQAGLELIVAEEDRLCPLTLVQIPDGVVDAAVRSALLNEHNIEIGAGLGKFAGKAWCIGLMGENATVDRADFVADALIETVAGRERIVA